MENGTDHSDQFLQTEIETISQNNCRMKVETLEKTYAGTRMDFKDEEIKLNSTTKLLIISAKIMA